MKNSEMRDLSEEVTNLNRRVDTLRRQGSGAQDNTFGLLPAAFEELQASLEELRVAEEELRLQNEMLAETRVQVEQERQRYYELFEFAPDGYIVTDPTGKILEANRATADLVGILPRYLTGKILAAYVAEEDVRQFRLNLLELAHVQEPQAWEIRLRRRHGPAVATALTVAPARDREGRLTSLRWMLRDVTERKRSEQQIQDLNASLQSLLTQMEQRVEERTAELRAAHGQLETILESISDAFYTLDAHSCFTYINPKAAKLWGKEREALLGRNIWDVFPQVIGTQAYQQICRALREQQAVSFDAWGTVVRRWIEVNVYPTGTGVSVLFQDISRRKQTEAALVADYQRERRIAETLQRSLLQTIPEDAFPGLTIATLYQPSSDDMLVGGDFFDAFHFDTGKVALVIGDVSGKGLEAAARTTQVKYALRAFLQETGAPAQALTRLNDFLCDAQRQEQWENASQVVLMVIVLDPHSGDGALAAAGSEPLLLVRADGRTEAAPVFGFLLGVEPGKEYQETALHLEPGDTLVIATDGITEARQGTAFLGFEGLERLARQHRASASLQQWGEAILSGAREFAGGVLPDDVCLLLAQRPSGHGAPCPDPVPL